jgi:excisionase family DNA binding protein
MLTEQLFTTPEAARLLTVSTSWLKKQVAAGLVPHTRLGCNVRFTSDQVKDIVQRASTTRDAEAGMVELHCQGSG